MSGKQIYTSSGLARGIFEGSTMDLITNWPKSSYNRGKSSYVKALTSGVTLQSLLALILAVEQAERKAMYAL